VGLAIGSNPAAVIVPCHRVIGADHSLTGYGGGLPRKRWLLEHEGLDLSGGRVRQRQVEAQPSFPQLEEIADVIETVL
ncbi:MAG: methylated-DNA--[protein]-cysteine S-methyltransferase, partial [Bacteroidota bacterium]